VIDPLTESEADFVLDQSCINVEKLLLQAIACNVHTRLLDVQRVLKGGISWWADSDIVLRHSIPADLEIPNEVS
jgi:mediator of RNA polymerase II transcription subunit 14